LRAQHQVSGNRQQVSDIKGPLSRIKGK
jgi:DNA-binding NtrC family response regulator